MRPEWAVMRRAMPAAAAAAIKRTCDDAGGERDDAIARLGLCLGSERAEGSRYTVLHVPEVGRLTGRVRLSRFGRERGRRRSGRRRRSHRTSGGRRLRIGATRP